MIAEYVAVDDLEKKNRFDQSEKGRNATMLFFFRVFVFSDEMRRCVRCLANLEIF